MSDTLEITEDDIDLESSDYSLGMALLPDVFFFNYEHLNKISARLGSGEKMSNRLDKLTTYVEESSLDQERKSEMIQLISEEKKVLKFSQVSRRSVIEL